MARWVRMIETRRPEKRQQRLKKSKAYATHIATEYDLLAGRISQKNNLSQQHEKSTTSTANQSICAWTDRKGKLRTRHSCLQWPSMSSLTTDRCRSHSNWPLSQTASFGRLWPKQESQERLDATNEKSLLRQPRQCRLCRIAVGWGGGKACGGTTCGSKSREDTSPAVTTALPLEHSKQ